MAKAKTVTLELTKLDLQILRGLIVREAQKLGAGRYQRRIDEPSALRRLHSVADKIWTARQEFE